MPPAYGTSLASLVGLPGQPIGAQPSQGQADQTPPDIAMGADGLGLTAESGQASRMEIAPAISNYTVKTDKNGVTQYTVTMSEDAFRRSQELMSRGSQAGPLVELAKIGQQAVAARQQEINRLQSKLDVIEKYPVVAQLGRIAALAASAYVAPGSRGEGLVRAAGAYASPLIAETPERLAAEIANAEQDKVRTMLPIAQMQASEADRAEARAYREQNFRQAAEQARQNNITNALRPIERQAGEGDYVDRKAAMASLIAAKATPEEAKAHVDELVSLSEGARRRYEEQKAEAHKEWQARFDADKAQRATELKQQREISTADRTVSLAMAQFGAISDDRNKIIGDVIQGQRDLESAWTLIFGGKPMPKDPRAAQFQINAAVADPKNKEAVRAAGDDPQKFLAGVSKAAAGVMRQAELPSIDERKAAMALRLRQSKDPNLLQIADIYDPPEKPAAPVKLPDLVPPTLAAQFQGMTPEQFKARIPELLASGMSQSMIAGIFDAIKERAATVAGNVAKPFKKAAVNSISAFGQ